jgi:glucosylglycerate synthase
MKEVERADIVVGIPSYNNARTIGHVVRAAHTGLAKYFPQFTSVIVNSDGGSTDGTREAVLSSEVDVPHILLLTTPLKAVHRLSFPYHGIPGKGSAFRGIFERAEGLGAKVCAVVDADLRSITPEWIDLLVRPVLLHGYDFTAPYYHRHKYDGTITNSIVYPLTRALYGKRIRQPIGGDFGLSKRLVEAYLKRDAWQTDVARFGIDIWMTTVAVAEGYQVCQSYLGAKLHDAKDPSSDLSAMLTQVLGSLFDLMEEYHGVWEQVAGSQMVDLFGFRYDVGLEPVQVNLERMLHSFGQGVVDLEEIWSMALQPETLAEVKKAAARARGANPEAAFRLPDEVWVRTVYDFACAHHARGLGRDQLLRSFTPLYLGRVASQILDTRDLDAHAFEERMEGLCLSFEGHKDYLRGEWRGERFRAAGAAPRVVQEVSP